MSEQSKPWPATGSYWPWHVNYCTMARHHRHTMQSYPFYSGIQWKIQDTMTASFVLHLGVSACCQLNSLCLIVSYHFPKTPSTHQLGCIHHILQSYGTSTVSELGISTYVYCIISLPLAPSPSMCAHIIAHAAQLPSPELPRCLGFHWFSGCSG